MQGYTLAVNAQMATWCACADGTANCYCAKADTISARPPRYMESVLGDVQVSADRSQAPGRMTPSLIQASAVLTPCHPWQPEAPRIIAKSTDITCDNSDERPSEMSWNQIQHGALSALMSWGVEYAKNNYADPVVMKDASDDLASFERRVKLDRKAKAKAAAAAAKANKKGA